MRDLQIARTLWQLKVRVLMEIPAATAFERSIWQDRPLRRSRLENRVPDECRDAGELIENARLEEGRPGDHDARDQRPEQPSTGPKQIF